MEKIFQGQSVNYVYLLVNNFFKVVTKRTLHILQQGFFRF